MRLSSCACRPRRWGRDERREGRPIGVRVGGEAHVRERADGKPSVADLYPPRAPTVLVEVGVCGEKVVLLALRQRGHAVDVMMAVALDMGEPEQVDQGEILLHRQSGLGGEILTGHEVALTAGLRVPQP